jgi:hypothetical protein
VDYLRKLSVSTLHRIGLQADRRTGMNLEGNGTQFVSQKHH